MPPFDDVVKALDKNANGRLEAGELPAGPIKQRFTQVDLDKDGWITKAEYERFRGLFGRRKTWCWRSARAGPGT